MTECKYCQQGRNNEPLISGKKAIKSMLDAYITGDVTIFGNQLCLRVDSYDEGGFEKDVDIDFCPRCRRYLGKESKDQRIADLIRENVHLTQKLEDYRNFMAEFGA